MRHPLQVAASPLLKGARGQPALLMVVVAGYATAVGVASTATLSTVLDDEALSLLSSVGLRLVGPRFDRLRLVEKVRGSNPLSSTSTTKDPQVDLTCGFLHVSLHERFTRLGGCRMPLDEAP